MSKLEEAIELLDRRNAAAVAQFMDARRREAIRVAHHHHVAPADVLQYLKTRCLCCGGALPAPDAYRDRGHRLQEKP